MKINFIGLVRIFFRGSLLLPLALSMQFFTSGCVPPSPPMTRVPAPEEEPEVYASPVPTPQVEDVEPGLEVEETEEGIRVQLSGDVLFDFNSSEISPAAETILLRVADVIKQYPDADVLIEGHTDSIGSNTYNLRLSRGRADAVKDWLVENGGIDAERVQTKGWGESRPVAANENADGTDNPEGRKQNRRVEILVSK